MENDYTVISFGRSFNPPNWYYNPTHLVNRIYYICGGSAFYKKNLPLKQGYLYIFRASPDFKVNQLDDNPIDHVFFDFVTYRRFIEEEYIEINLTDYPQLKALMEIIKEDFNNPPRPASIAKAFLDIIINYLQDYLISDVMYSPLTSSVLQTIHGQDISTISVSSIATSLNMNVNHIIRCFKKELGITPHKYISTLKTELTISYIRQGLSFTEIADKLGYSSISALSSAFKKETGKNLSSFKS